MIHAYKIRSCVSPSSPSRHRNRPLAMAPRAKTRARSSKPDLEVEHEADLKRIRDLVACAMAIDGQEKEGLVSAVEQIFEILLKLELAYYTTLSPMRVGVHPDNRYGLGIVATWMHLLMSKIVRMGWSDDACAGAVCVEDDDDQSCAKYTMNMQQGSEMFGTQTMAQIAFGSLAGGHTNQGLVAIKSAVKCEHDILSCDGRMSEARIVEYRPRMAVKINQGMNWLVLKAIVIVLFPNLPRIIQAARQAIGQVQNCEGIFELLQGIQSMIPAADSDTDWDSIKLSVGKSESPHKADIPELVEFVAKYGGGSKGKFLKRALTFVTYCVPEDQFVGISTIQAMTGLKLKGDEHCPNVMAAILEAQSKCPHRFVKSKVCKYISDVEISNLGNRIGELREAESILVQVWKLAEEMEPLIPKHQFVIIMGRFDCLVARVLLKKPLPEDIETFEHCAAKALDELQIESKKECSDFVIEHSPWKAMEKKASEGDNTKRLLSSAYEYDDEGKILSVCKIELFAKGFTVGALVKNKSGAIFKIEEIDIDGLIMIRPAKADGGWEKRLIQSKLDPFLQRYSITTEMHELLDTKGNSFEDDPVTKEIVRASELFLKMRHLYLEHESDTLIKKKPERSVVVTRPYKLGALVLVMGYQKPMSIHEGKKGENEIPYASYIVKGHGKTMKKMWVSPTFSKPYIPAWWCAITSDKSQSNAIIEWREEEGVQFPCIVNTEPLKKGDAVVRYLPRKVPVASADKTLDRKLSHASSTAMGPPSHKARKE